MHIRPLQIKFFITTILIFILLSTYAGAASFQGRVVRVLDGDTIEVLHNGKAERIRLHGVDSPEAGQAYGNKAKQFVLKIAAQQIVTVEVTDTDRYGRTVGEVILPGGSSLNRELVREGYAWWYRKYSKDETLGALEKEAKETRKGLWADKDPVPPWEWRAVARNQEKEPTNQVTRKDLGAQYPYHGNTSSKVFHQSSCKDFNCKNCTETLAGRDEAIREGFRPCGMCNP